MGSVEIEDFKNRVDKVLAEVMKVQIEQGVNEVENFYSITVTQSNNSKGGSASKEKDKDRPVANFKMQKRDPACRQIAASERMQKLILQFGALLRQITQHKWAFPFMEPVDVKGLGLHDYYQVIDKPMDFSTIKKQMEAKDTTGYKHVREICADVRLVFKNAMKYNDEKNDVHVMAKTLLAKFEEKWLQFLPKVTEEEKRREEEAAEAQLNTRLNQEFAHAKLALNLSNELLEAEFQLVKLREQLVENHRKMSRDEKRHLATALTRLSTEDLDRALDIVAQTSLDFEANAQQVEIDIDSQDESTLWRLKMLAKDAHEAQKKSALNTSDNSNDKNDNSNLKAKREVSNALPKAPKKKSTKIRS